MTETPSVPDDKVRVQLSRPVQAHGAEISELVFRQPTGGDIVRCGNPVKINMAAADPELTFDETKMTRMMAVLAAVPESTIGALSASDWMFCAYSVASFFMPSEPTPSNSVAG